MRGFWRLVILSGGRPTEHTEYTERSRSNFLLLVHSVCSVCSVGKKKFNDQPFPYHHELEMEVSTLTNLGVGLGRVLIPDVQPSAVSGQPNAAVEAASPGIENRESKIENSATRWVVMVPFTLPGEKVKVRVYRNHKNYSEADLLEVLTPSPHRIDPRCPLFGRCGGCQYQHLTYPEQLKWKRQQVEELLKYMAGVEFLVAPVIASPREFGYRSKITPHFQAPRLVPTALQRFVQGGGCSGFQYGFDFDETVGEDDFVSEQYGAKLVVDSMSYQYLLGAVIDYKEDLQGAQFVIKNPNATSTCGCGSSFSA